MSKMTAPAAVSGPIIESRSIDFVPLSERHGKAWHQGPFWFSGNFVLSTLVLGFLGPAIGLSIWASVLASTLGVIVGTFFMAFHANQGPRMGLPQMVQSRAQFGSRGAIVPLLATIFVYIGFNIFNLVFLTESITTVLPGNKWVWYPVFSAVILIVAIIGHDLLHFIQRWMAYIMLVMFAIFTVLALTQFSGQQPVLSGGWEFGPFLAMFSAAAGYQISYAVYVSDYSRYLRPDTSARKVIGWTFAGAALSAIWLTALGAVLSSYLAAPEAVGSLVTVGNNAIPLFGTALILVSIPAQIGIGSVNAYGAMLTTVAAFDGFRPLVTGRRTRIIAVAIIMIVTTVVALLLPDDYLGNFNSFVLLMLYFLVPWTAVNLADFYFVRRGHYAITEIFNPAGIYGRWGSRGLVSYFAGFIAMIPFMNTSFYIGPIAQALGGTDLSFVIGLVIAGGLYLILSRNFDPTSENAAIAQSDLELGAPGEGTPSAPASTSSASRN